MDDVGDDVPQIIPNIFLFSTTTLIFFFHRIISILIFFSKGPFPLSFILFLGFDDLLLFLWVGVGCIEIEKVIMLREVGEI